MSKMLNDETSLGAPQILIAAQDLRVALTALAREQGGDVSRLRKAAQLCATLSMKQANRAILNNS
jgi:hypothetical protein